MITNPLRKSTRKHVCWCFTYFCLSVFLFHFVSHCFFRKLASTVLWLQGCTIALLVYDSYWGQKMMEFHPINYTPKCRLSPMTPWNCLYSADLYWMPKLSETKCFQIAPHMVTGFCIKLMMQMIKKQKKTILLLLKPKANPVDKHIYMNTF